MINNLLERARGMKILLIAFYFSRERDIGAIRPRMLAKNWSEQGHDVTVATWMATDEIDNRSYNVISLYPPNCVQLSEAEKRNIESNKVYLKKLRTFGATAKGYIKQYKEAIKLYNYLMSNVSIEDFDTVVATFGPMQTIITGFLIKKQFPRIVLCIDIRDAIYPREVSEPGFTWYHRYMQKRVASLADKIVVVAESAANEKHMRLASEKVSVITNGFDNTRLAKYRKHIFETDKFRMVYAGSIYKERARAFTYFVQLINELIQEGKISASSCELIYAGDDFEEFCEALRCLKDITIIDRGFLPKEEVFELQASAVLLLAISYCDYKKKLSINPGKIYECMGLGRPILLLISGNMKNNHAKEIIRKTSSGFCFEEENQQKDYLDMKQYVYDLYKKWETKKLTDCFNESMLEFDYSSIADRYITMLKMEAESKLL